VLVQPQPVTVTVTASGIRARRDGLSTSHESLVLGWPGPGTGGNLKPGRAAGPGPGPASRLGR
jgi:hypothetical protein